MKNVFYKTVFSNDTWKVVGFPPPPPPGSDTETGCLKRLWNLHLLEFIQLHMPASNLICPVWLCPCVEYMTSQNLYQPKRFCDYIMATSALNS